MAVMNKASARPKKYAIDIGITTSEMLACIEIRKAVTRFTPHRAIAQSREQEGSPKHVCVNGH